MGWQDILTDPEDVKQVIADTKEPLFLVYYADVSQPTWPWVVLRHGFGDTLTSRPLNQWCPDCQATKPILEKTFGPDKAPTAIQVMVGERPM